MTSSLYRTSLPARFLDSARAETGEAESFSIEESFVPVGKTLDYSSDASASVSNGPEDEGCS